VLGHDPALTILIVTSWLFTTSPIRELDDRVLGPPHGLVHLPDRVVHGHLCQTLLGDRDRDRDSYGGGDGA
jgi:hypothetical protein